MNAPGVFHSAMLVALRADPAFGGALNGVFEAPVSNAAPPYADIGELLVADWGAKQLAGVELRTAILVRDRFDGPARLHSLAAAADAAMAGISRDLNGWRIASLVMLRTRIVRDGPGMWTALVEHRVRMIESQ